MHTLDYPETTKWVVAHNNEDIFHVAEVQSNNCFTTGQPFMEVFNTKEDLLAKFPNLSEQLESIV